MPPRKRDRSFLYMAAVAGAGGLLAVVVAIGVPIWSWLHGQPYNPAFSLFAGWGIAALGGCYGCLHTYYLTDEPPPRPPRGGLRIVAISPAPTPMPPATENNRIPEQRAA